MVPRQGQAGCTALSRCLSFLLECRPPSCTLLASREWPFSPSCWALIPVLPQHYMISEPSAQLSASQLLWMHLWVLPCTCWGSRKGAVRFLRVLRVLSSFLFLQCLFSDTQLGSCKCFFFYPLRVLLSSGLFSGAAVGNAPSGGSRGQGGAHLGASLL